MVVPEVITSRECVDWFSEVIHVSIMAMSIFVLWCTFLHFVNIVWKFCLKRKLVMRGGQTLPLEGWCPSRSLDGRFACLFCNNWYYISVSTE